MPVYRRMNAVEREVRGSFPGSEARRERCWIDHANADVVRNRSRSYRSSISRLCTPQRRDDTKHPGPRTGAPHVAQPGGVIGGHIFLEIICAETAKDVVGLRKEQPTREP